MPNKARILVVLLVVAVSVAAGRSAAAAVLNRLYLDEMANESAVIVHATVVSSRSEWSAGRTVIQTIYTARAHQYLKGFLGETFEYRQRGGEVGILAMYVPGSPVFQPGEEVLMFLWTDGASGTYQCLGFEQGVLRVREENGIKVVNRSIPIRAESGTRPAAVALGPQALATSRNLRALMGEVALAVARAETAARKEAR